MKRLTCITCPNSCQLFVEETGGLIKITGNKCKRGRAFAESEILNPLRTLTTTVATSVPRYPVLPVRSAGGIPKGRIREAMDLLNSITVSSSLRIGEIVVENLLGLGVDVIASSDILSQDSRLL